MASPLRQISALFGRARPRLSLVVILHDMPDQAQRTLFSLSPRYQRDVSRRDYEVIVVENASERTLGREKVLQHGDNFSYFLREQPAPSPVFAINFGAAQARGDMIGIMVDGARMLTPGAVKYILMAGRLSPFAVAAIPGYHLGRQLQQDAALSGHDAQEDLRLLAQIGWPEDGYRLFEIACFSATSRPGFFRYPGESNCLSVPRSIWEEIGGCDERFDLPGGGLVNLDLYKRVAEHRRTVLVNLIGEGCCHQFHGGVTTSTRSEAREQLVADQVAQYVALRGRKYRNPRVRSISLGLVPDAALEFVRRSVERAQQDLLEEEEGRS
ncbi:MAG: glycosyltransferase family A protein [Planctomycetota bacterium]